MTYVSKQAHQREDCLCVYIYSFLMLVIGSDSLQDQTKQFHLNHLQNPAGPPVSDQIVRPAAVKFQLSKESGSCRCSQHKTMALGEA